MSFISVKCYMHVICFLCFVMYVYLLLLFFKNKQMIKKPAQIRFYSKRPHTIAKMNDSINTESTLSGLMNARYLTPKLGW